MATIRAGNIYAIPDIFDERLTNVASGTLLKLRRLRRWLQEVAEDLDKAQADLRKRFFEKDENGELKTREVDGVVQYVIIEGKEDEFKKDWEELLEQELEVPDEIRLNPTDLDGVRFHWRHEQVLGGILLD